MRNLSLSAALTALILSPGCSKAPVNKEQPAAGNPAAPPAEEFEGKYIRTLGKHHYVTKPAHGTAIWYYQSGKKQTARTFLNGKLEGAMVMWYEDGNKKYAVNYVANQKNGRATGWYSDGKLDYTVDYDHGLKHGKAMQYWSNGEKKFEYTWYQDRKTGVLAWDNKGEPMQVPPTKTRQPIRQPVKSGSSKKK